MNGEGRPEGRPPHSPTGIDKPTIARKADEPRLFDPARYSPATVAILQKLPQSTARVFAIASALGSIRDQAGSDAPLKSGKQAAGTLITRRRLPAILQACGIGARMWRRHVEDWEARYAAHRCGGGLVFLFAAPVWDACPNCKTEILFDHVPPPVSKSRGRGFRAKAVQEVPVERSKKYRESGPRSTEAAVQEVPLFERESSPPLRRFQQGEAVGLREVPFEDLKGEDREAFLRAQDEIDKAGLGKIAPLRSRASLADRIATGASPADDEVADAS